MRHTYSKQKICRILHILGLIIEIDFFARKGNQQYYIQVTSDISNSETRAREFRPFILLNDQVRKIVVINKPINETLDENGFTIIGATDFLLRFLKS